MKAKTQPLSSQSIRRLQAGGLILRKFEVDEIAEITEASRSSVYRWKKRFGKPIIKDKRQSTEEVDLWISRTWPRIKKKRKSVVFR